jgi:hypothetical protein
MSEEFNNEDIELSAQPEVEVTEEIVTEQPTEPSVEDKARKMGWKPREDYKDSPEDWVSAEAFVARQPMIKQIKQMKKSVESLVRYNQNLEKRMKEADLNGYNRAIQDLKQRKEFAVDEAEIRYIDEQIHNVVENKKALEQEIKSPSPAKQEAVEFAQRNKDWFMVDQRLTDIAVRLEDIVKLENPELDDDEVLFEVERRMQPHLKRDKKVSTNPVAPVSQRGTATGSPVGKITINDLNDEAKATYRALHKVDSGFSVDDFINQAKLCNMDQELLKKR